MFFLLLLISISFRATAAEETQNTPAKDSIENSPSEQKQEKPRRQSYFSKVSPKKLPFIYFGICSLPILADIACNGSSNAKSLGIAAGLYTAGYLLYETIWSYTSDRNTPQKLHLESLQKEAQRLDITDLSIFLSTDDIKKEFRLWNNELWLNSEIYPLLPNDSTDNPRKLFNSNDPKVSSFILRHKLGLIKNRYNAYTFLARCTGFLASFMIAKNLFDQCTITKKTGIFYKSKHSTLIAEQITDTTTKNLYNAKDVSIWPYIVGAAINGSILFSFFSSLQSQTIDRWLHWHADKFAMEHSTDEEINLTAEYLERLSKYQKERSFTSHNSNLTMHPDDQDRANYLKENTKEKVAS